MTPLVLVLDWIIDTSPSERDGEDGSLENLGALSADDGGNKIRAAVVLRRFDVLVVVAGLANPLLVLLLVGLLESFELEELAVEGGDGRYRTPVELGADDDIISCPCLVLDEDDDDE